MRASSANIHETAKILWARRGKKRLRGEANVGRWQGEGGSSRCHQIMASGEWKGWWWLELERKTFFFVDFRRFSAKANPEENMGTNCRDR